jgi:sRNA-binding protein
MLLCSGPHQHMALKLEALEGGMTPNTPRQKQAARTLQMLVDRYSVFACGRPLKVRVAADLQTALPDIGASLLVAAIRLHTNTPSYQRTLIQGGPRYDLDGNIAGEVDIGQIAHAIETLAKVEGSPRERQGYERTVILAGGKATPLISAAPSICATTPVSPMEVPASAAELPSEPKRLSLADLREAARRRRAMEGA